MVCIRCKMIVKDELSKLGLHVKYVELGEAEIEQTLTTQQHDQMKIDLDRWGLELMDDKKAMLMEKIKNVIIENIHYTEDELLVNFSVYLSEKLNYDYNYLSNLFSETMGTTIEHFIIVHKIERVKELLVYDELSLTEIAWKMHYSSVAHLSNQFKKITGLTPSHFKKLKQKRFSSLDNLRMI